MLWQSCLHSDLLTHRVQCSRYLFFTGWQKTHPQKKYRLGARRPERCQCRWIKTRTDYLQRNCSVRVITAAKVILSRQSDKTFLTLKTQVAVWLHQPTFFIKSLKSMKIFSSSIIQSIEPPQRIKHGCCRWSGGGRRRRWGGSGWKRRLSLKSRARETEVKVEEKEEEEGYRRRRQEREHERRRWRKKERRKRDRMIHALSSSRAKRRI